MMPTPPYDQIRVLYIAEGGPMTWEELVGWHLAAPQGYVIKTPEFFVMGRPVVKATGELVTDLTQYFPPDKCDAWYLFAFAGDMKKAWASLPYPLPWLAWHRVADPEKELRFVPSASIARLL